MDSIAEFIRRVARQVISAGKFKPVEIRIYFSAPNPSHPSGETLTMEEEKTFEANFQWVKYGVLFTDKSGEFYIYTVTLNPWGTKQEDAQIIKSDSEWNLYKDEEVTIVPSEVEQSIPVLREPALHPPKGMRTNYINTGKSDKGHQYSSEEFKKFDDDFFVVLTKSKNFETPFGKTVGGMGEPKEEKK